MDCAAVQLDDRLGDGQTESESLLARIDLLEGVKNLFELLRLDANDAVADLGRDPLRSRIGRADAKLPLLGRELAGIAQHVPKYLLHTCRISEQSAVGCLQIEGKSDVAILDVATHNLNRVLM